MYQNAIELSHEYIERTVCAGDIVIDATAGNGNDTFLLAGLSKKVYAFDISKEAINNTATAMILFILLNFFNSIYLYVNALLVNKRQR